MIQQLMSAGARMMLKYMPPDQRPNQMVVVGLIESLTPAQMEEPGYFSEGWSVKDLMAHIGSWQAEAGQVLVELTADGHDWVERSQRRLWNKCNGATEQCAPSRRRHPDAVVALE